MRLLASGCYIYETHGIERAQEPWRVFETEDGHRLTIAERLAPEFNAHLEVVVRDYPNFNRCCGFTFRDGPDGLVLAHADYRVNPQRLEFRRKPEEEWQVQELGNAYFFPLMRIFSGEMVTALARAGGGGDVVTPVIVHPNLDANVFVPTTSLRTVSRSNADAPIYHYQGGPYEQPATLLLNANDVLERYSWTQPNGETWVCRLVHD